MNAEPITERCELCNRYVWKAGERYCIKHDMMAVLSAAPLKYAPCTPKGTRGMVSKRMAPRASVSGPHVEVIGSSSAKTE